MSKITDIWFTTCMSLIGLADKLGLKDIYEDEENYWEWVTGSYIGNKLDITRTNTVSPKKTKTRVFILGANNEFSDELSNDLVGKLKNMKISPIFLGQWICKQGNNFEEVIIKTET